MATISEEFPGADYVPFTPGERILDQLVDGISLDWMRELTGADFWGLYVKKSCGAMKKALYNVHGMLPLSAEAQAQQAYRDALWADFSIATNEVELGETLVLNMFGTDGWAVEATRGESGWSFDYKHSPLYRSHWRDTGNTTLEITGNSASEKITLKRNELFAVKGVIEPLSWTPLAEKTLRIHRTDGSMVLVRAEPIHGAATDKHSCFVTEYESADTSGPCIVQIQGGDALWDSVVDYLEWNARGMPVE